MTVQEELFKLVQRIDPRIRSTGAEFALTTVGTLDGEKFTKQRHIDVLNEARFALFKALENGLSAEDLTSELGGTLVRDSKIFASGSIEKPAGLIRFVSLSLNTSPYTQIFLLPTTLMDVVRGGKNSHFTESATNIFVFDVGDEYTCVGGATIIPDATVGTLTYFGLSAFSLTDVTGATVETINEKYYPVILELAQAIAEEQGNVQVNQLATKLLGGQ